MSEPRNPPEYVYRARCKLDRAAVRTPNSCLEDLCAEAESAVERAIKGVLIERGVRYPISHNLARLLKCLRDHGEQIPDEVRKASRLSVYAAMPGIAKDVTEDHYQEALHTAEAVVRWAERIVLGRDGAGIT